MQTYTVDLTRQFLEALAKAGGFDLRRVSQLTMTFTAPSSVATVSVDYVATGLEEVAKVGLAALQANAKAAP